jgi:ankyrin repeat protein
VWAVSPWIVAETFAHGTSVEDSQLFDVADFDDTWALPTLRNKRLTKIAREIQSFGLGSFDDILLSLIPPLSFHGLLPNEPMVAVLLRKRTEYESLHDYRAYEAYLSISRLDLDPRRNDRIAYEIVVELLEFLFMACETVDNARGVGSTYEDKWTYVNKESSNYDATLLAGAVSRVSSHLRLHELLRGAIRRLRPLLVLQRRDGMLEALFPEGELENIPDRAGLCHLQPSRPSSDPSNMLLDLCKFSHSHRFGAGIYDEGNIRHQLVEEADIFGWYPLHYAAIGTDGNVFLAVSLSIKWREKNQHDLKNKSGKTPLHYAAVYFPDTIHLLYDEQTVKVAASMKGRDGMLPIHCAARHGNLNSTNTLMPHSDTRITDKFGHSCLHHGAIGGHDLVVHAFLKQKDASPQATEDLFQRTPLHLALLHNNYSVAGLLLSTEDGFEALAMADYVNLKPIDIILAQSNTELFQTLWRSLSQMVAKFQHTPTVYSCFLAIMERLVHPDRQNELPLLVHDIIHQKWGTSWICDVFRIVCSGANWWLLCALLDMIDAAGEISSLHETKELFPDVGRLNVSESDLNLSVCVRQYLSAKCSFKESTALIWAIRNGDISIIEECEERRLIDLNKTPEEVHWNEKDAGNRSPLAWLAKARPTPEGNGEGLTIETREKVLAFLCSTWSREQKKKALNETQGRYNKTPLMYAAKNGLESLVELFVRNGAEVRGYNQKRWSAFSYALDREYYGICRILVDHDTEIANETIMPSAGHTPLTHSVFHSKLNHVDFLGACNRVDPNLADKLGRLPLSICLEKGDPELLQRFIERFPTVDPHTTNATGSSPLIQAYGFAALIYERDHNSRFLRKLLALPRIDMRKYEVSLMVSHAICHDAHDVLNLLLESDADPNSSDDWGRAPVYLAALYGDFHTFYMIRQKLNSSTQSKEQLESVYHACACPTSRFSEQIIAELLKDNIDPNIPDTNGWTALECASRAGNESVRRVLEDHKPTTEGIMTQCKFPTLWAIRADNPFFNIDLSEAATGHVFLRESRTVPLYAWILRVPDINDQLPVQLDTVRLSIIRTDHCIPYRSLYYWELLVVNCPEFL